MTDVSASATSSKVHKPLLWLSGLYVLAMLAVFFLIGASNQLFESRQQPLEWELHIMAGTIAWLLSLIMLIVGAVGRAGRIVWLTSLVLVVLNFIQQMLPEAEKDYLFIAALHPVNAVLMTLLGGWLHMRLRYRAVQAPAVALRAG